MHSARVVVPCETIRSCADGLAGGGLVAEACADGDLVATLGAPAVQHGSARLGLHAGQEPVGLGAVAAVGLEGTLRHLIRLLLNLIAVCNSLPVYLKVAKVPNQMAKKRVIAARKSLSMQTHP